MTSEMGAEAITKEAFAGWTIPTKIGGELGRSEIIIISCRVSKLLTHEWNSVMSFVCSGQSSCVLTKITDEDRELFMTLYVAIIHYPILIVTNNTYASSSSKRHYLRK